MKKRYLVLLAVIAAAFILLFPATALAATSSVSGAYPGQHFDLDTGSVVAADGGWEFSYFWLPNLIGSGGQPIFSWAAGLEFAFYSGDKTYDAITLSDVQDLAYHPLEGITFGPLPYNPVFPLRTADGRYFKLQGVGIGPTCTFMWEALPAATPETRLRGSADFIVTKAALGYEAGGMDPEMAPSLTAKVNGALAALARGNENDAKVAMNDLKALVNQVEAQTDKKISVEAADEIIAQANAIIQALGY